MSRTSRRDLLLPTAALALAGLLAVSGTAVAQILNPAKSGAQTWLDKDYKVMRFAPTKLNLRPGDGPPHIRLDRAVEFLIGDRL